jgi:L-arabinonolactonase
MPQIDIAFKGDNRLGESPVWNEAERALYWIDGLRPALHRLEVTGRHSSWPMPQPIGSFVFRRRGGLIGAFKNGFAAIDLSSGRIDPLCDPEPERPANVLNDGKCDRRGRYWCGSRAADLSSPVASLFRLDSDLHCYKLDDGFAVSNGIAWSPDDRTMYFADSPSGLIFAYEFDLDDGAIRNRRIFASTSELEGLPDGAAVDHDGHYWCALFGGSAIARFDPRGRLASTLRLPVKNPTMCAFGGDRLDVLYVTSARARMSDAELAAHPLAGSLLAITGLRARGRPETTFAG